MNYEKKYKELHGFISDLYPHLSEYCKEKLDGFLPELKESEDEKIRKDLISYLKSDKEFEPSQSDAFYSKSIAWLKRKDEQHEQSLIDLNCKLEEQQENYEELKKRYNEAVEREKIATKIINELRARK